MMMLARLGLALAGVAVATSAIAAETTRASASPSNATISTPASSSNFLYFRDSGPSSTLNAQGLSSFTPALLDGKQAGRSSATALRPNATRSRASERTFLFTPSGRVGDRKAFAVGVTARSVAADKASATETDVSGYNLGVSVGFRGFSVEAGYSRMEDQRLASGEGVDVGLSYRGKDWKTSLQVAGEHYGAGRVAPALNVDKSYSVELGGSYLLTPRLSVNGGVKYQVAYPRSELRTQHQDESNSSIYLGTAFKF